MVTRVQPGRRILSSEQPNFYRLPKCVHQHSSVHYSKLPPSPSCLPLFSSQSFVSVLLCSMIDLLLKVRVEVLVALRGRLEERRVRPCRASALHWPHTGARRPFAAAGSGTGGLQPKPPPSSPLKPLPAAARACMQQDPAPCCYVLS